MFVWSKKAEQDYRTRHPHRKNERKAGSVIMWEGRELKAGTILDGYASRGWVYKMAAERPHNKERLVTKGNKGGHMLSNGEKRKRWYKLLYYFSQPGKLSLKAITEALGYKSHCVVSDFVKTYGEELAGKYGKLPYNEGLKSKFWKDVMEAAQ